MNYKKLISSLVLFGLPCISLIIYYSFFINKGIVLGDEGYYLHITDRMLQGQIPYKDFFLQYPPGHFYILALFFKLFGISVITGRILTLAYCLSIFILTLYFLYEYKSYSRRSIIIALLCTASFGFPLLNIPIVVWPSVIITILMMVFFIEMV